MSETNEPTPDAPDIAETAPTPEEPIFDIPEELPGTVADALDSIQAAQAVKTPAEAAMKAEALLRLFIRHPDDPGHLHDALGVMIQGLQLLAQGQSAIIKDVADLNIHAGDLDTTADPIAPPPPGVERPTREPVTAKSSAAAAAAAAKTLQPTD